MALQITQWNILKILLFVFDILILLLNITLFILLSYILLNEYYLRGTLKLFFTPFIIGVINLVIDTLMNSRNYKMKYAGHNRYGMLTRFFMFYFVIIIIIYSDQRAKYIIKEAVKDIKTFIIILGIIDIGFIFISMICSFCIIDVQSFKQIWIKKRKKKKVKISMENVGRIDSKEIIDS